MIYQLLHDHGRLIHDSVTSHGWIHEQIRQNLKQVVVQRSVTSDRKASPRPPVPVNPRQDQFMWT